MRVFPLASICGLVVLFAAPTFADTYTYTYTGHTYQSVSGVYTTGERVTGEATLAAPLAANVGTSASPVSVSPLSFSFSDGVQTITDTSAGLQFAALAFSTNAAGIPIWWSVGMLQLQLEPGTTSYYRNTISTANSATFAQDVGANGLGEGLNAYEPGSWTLTVNPAGPSAVTPEPGSLGLVVTGIFGVMGWARRPA